MLDLLETERQQAEIAQQIYDLRTAAGLTQCELAARVGTTASVICRLEDADYDRYSLTMLRRIAAAQVRGHRPISFRYRIHALSHDSLLSPDRSGRTARR